MARHLPGGRSPATGSAGPRSRRPARVPRVLRLTGPPGRCRARAAHHRQDYGGSGGARCGARARDATGVAGLRACALLTRLPARHRRHLGDIPLQLDRLVPAAALAADRPEDPGPERRERCPRHGHRQRRLHRDGAACLLPPPPGQRPAPAARDVRGGHCRRRGAGPRRHELAAGVRADRAGGLRHRRWPARAELPHREHLPHGAALDRHRLGHRHRPHRFDHRLGHRRCPPGQRRGRALLHTAGRAARHRRRPTTLVRTPRASGSARTAASRTSQEATESVALTEARG